MSKIILTSPFLPDQMFFMETAEKISEPKLKKDGTPKKTKCNKKKGKKSEVYSLTIEDASRILQYFAEKEQWLHYLLFTISCNIARRNSDIISLRWENFFNPTNGEFRKDLLEITEQKTGKIANPHINNAIKNAIKLYCEKTGCDPSANGYKGYIAYQLSGTHKGKVMTYGGCINGIKKAAENLGIEYNVGTHSGRKTFGALMKQIHPNDPKSMEKLQRIYNHSSPADTSRYIGLDKESEDKYYNDMGDLFSEYIVEGKEFIAKNKTPIVSIDINDLREIIKEAYIKGFDNAEKSNPEDHIGAINEIMNMIEEKINE